jgi:hypothetical protein
MHQNLSDGSSESNSQSQLDVQDNISRSWTYGDIVVHKHQARESTSPGLGHRKRNLRNELRGPEVREAIMAGVVIALFLAGVVVPGYSPWSPSRCTARTGPTPSWAMRPAGCPRAPAGLTDWAAGTWTRNSSGRPRARALESAY